MPTRNTSKRWGMLTMRSALIEKKRGQTNMDEYEYDEGSDIDNWETEQVFRDNEGEDDEPTELEAILDNLREILEKYGH